MTKVSILFVINSMGCGGAEKSLLSLLSLLDYEKYDVTLQMFSRGGMFESLLPQNVHIRKDLDYSAYCQKSFVKQLASFDLRRNRMISPSLGARAPRLILLQKK